MINSALKEWINKIRTGDARKVLLENRNEIKRCPMCDHNVEDRQIAIYEELVNQLYAIYCWCGEHKIHEFKMGDIKHLLDKNGYTRFNDLIQCSNGILYRPVSDEGAALKKGHYGMHMARAKDFFKGGRTIHLQISMNQITGDWKVLKEVKVGEIPQLRMLLDREGIYDWERLL